MWDKIKERREADAKSEARIKISEWRMLLQIVSAPHTRDGAGISNLMEQFDEMEQDIQNPERIKQRKDTRAKMKELLAQQIEELKSGEGQ